MFMRIITVNKNDYKVTKLNNEFWGITHKDDESDIVFGYKYSTNSLYISKDFVKKAYDSWDGKLYMTEKSFRIVFYYPDKFYRVINIVNGIIDSIYSCNDQKEALLYRKCKTLDTVAVHKNKTLEEVTKLLPNMTIIQYVVFGKVIASNTFF